MAHNPIKALGGSGVFGCLVFRRYKNNIARKVIFKFSSQLSPLEIRHPLPHCK